MLKKIPHNPYHKKNVIKHSGNRARERYDIWLEQDIQYLKKAIIHYMASPESDDCRSKNTIMLLYRETRKSDRYHFLIEWREKYLWIVWNSSMKTIQTFMPIDGLKSRIARLSNSVVGFLVARNIIDINDARICDVIGVSKSKVNNDSLWINQPIDEEADHIAE